MICDENFKSNQKQIIDLLGKYNCNGKVWKLIAENGRLFDHYYTEKSFSHILHYQIVRYGNSVYSYLLFINFSEKYEAWWFFHSFFNDEKK